VLNRLSREYRGDEGGLIDEVKKLVPSLFGKTIPEVVINTPAPPASVATAPAIVDGKKAESKAGVAEKKTKNFPGCG
jgi:ribosomal protein L12E/L44/L45/RPP1/RPP2